MKKYIINLFAILILLSACEDILDKNPEDSYSDPVVWSDIDLARIYLTRAYNQVEYGLLGKKLCLGAFSDEMVMERGWQTDPYNVGVITADNPGRDHGNLNWDHYSNIQRINLFLANVEGIADNYQGAEKTDAKDAADILQGEALFLRAWEYHAMMRHYGGLILFSEPFTLGDDYLGITRSTFSETIDFIVADCDEAASLLKLDSEMEMGRATKEAALALKSRVLLFAASDLTADGTANSELVAYTNPNRTALWTAARDAAKAVMDLGTTGLPDFGAPDQEAVAENYFAMFKAYTLSDKEVIWGRMFLPDVGNRQRHNNLVGPNGYDGSSRNGPMQQMVDSYEMEDGSKFSDHFMVNANKEYINISTKFMNENPYYNREPRFYATVLYDGADWVERWPNLILEDPMGTIDTRTREVWENGQLVSRRFGLDTRQGPVAPWNGNYGGYFLKKYQDDTFRPTRGEGQYNSNIWIYLRYAEVVLNYAEACIELGDIPTATTYINMIRNRSGLPDFTGDITQAYRHERKMELAFEDHRWYDIRRWKILEEALPITPYGISILEKTEDGVTTTTWTQVQCQPNNNFQEKMYWMPIAADEIRRAPQLQQNPLY